LPALTDFKPMHHAETGMIKPPFNLLTAVLLVALVGCAGAEPTVVQTTVLGPFTGADAPLHPDNASPYRLEYYGTDLGFSYGHDGKIRFLFGDTWATEAYAPIEKSTGAAHDDSFGTIDMAAWPDPALITPRNMPRIKMGQHAGSGDMAALDPGYVMDLGKTPMGGFSNGNDEFGIFNITKPKACDSDDECGDLTCDRGLGYAGSRPDEQPGLTISCVDGSNGCNNDTLHDAGGQPIKGSGMCVSRTSSVWTDTDAGRAAAAAIRVVIGKRSRSDPRKYPETTEWLTNKFLNVTPRTVQDFVPANGPGYRNQDYNPAGATGRHRRVLLWGRPGFVGVGAAGRDLGLYFGWVDMPTGPGLDWKVHYYSGTDGQGRPVFSDSEKDAVALDLDSTHPGIQAEEIHDVVDQMSVVWVDHLKKWIMIYGGGMSTLPKAGLEHCGMAELFSGSDCRSVVIGNGAVRMRSADDPWGPWSPPQDVIVAGSPGARPPGGQYAPGGVLNHPDCVAPSCAPHTQTRFYNKREYGFFYAPNIIEQWIRPAGDAVDILWNASTWDPYRVVLLRTRIKP
jgi:hypothetical protein